ncbi:MAG: type II toxin-antitoxin system RelE/ParE family toxin [Candidatus Methylacidiphilales bacterium]
MKRVIIVRPEAEEDLEMARDWYDDVHIELGDRFLDEVASALEQLEQHPEQNNFYYLSFRRILFKRFPYKLFYQIMDNQIIVFRVLHAKQCHQQGLK